MREWRRWRGRRRPRGWQAPSSWRRCWTTASGGAPSWPPAATPATRSCPHWRSASWCPPTRPLVSVLNSASQLQQLHLLIDAEVQQVRQSISCDLQIWPAAGAAVNLCLMRSQATRSGWQQNHDRLAALQICELSCLHMQRYSCAHREYSPASRGW